MKGFGCPKASLGLLGLSDQLYQLRGLLIIDNGHSTWPLFDNQSIFMTTAITSFSVIDNFIKNWRP